MFKARVHNIVDTNVIMYHAESPATRHRSFEGTYRRILNRSLVGDVPEEAPVRLYFVQVAEGMSTGVVLAARFDFEGIVETLAQVHRFCRHREELSLPGHAGCRRG